MTYFELTDMDGRVEGRGVYSMQLGDRLVCHDTDSVSVQATSRLIIDSASLIPWSTMLHNAWWKFGD